MDEVYISYNCRSQDLKRTHANGPKDAACEQALIAMCIIRPHAANEKHQVSKYDDRPPSVLDSQPIGNEAGDTDGEDGPA